MSRPLNPESTPRVSPDDEARRAGTVARAQSVNALLFEFSHIAGRICPVYSLRPTTAQTNEDDTTTIGSGTTWDVPHYATAGLHFEISESGIDGADLGSFIGPASDQFGPAYCISPTISVVYPSAELNNFRANLPIDIAETWDDLASTTTNATEAATVAYGRRDQLADPGQILNATALGWLYSDMGAFNLTCRDLNGFGFIASTVDRRVIQTGETGSVVTDPYSHIIGEITAGDLGSSSSNARVSVTGMMVHGVTAELDHDRDASTGWTVIPGANPVYQPFGFSDPFTGQILTQPVRDLIHLDRTCYADRGQVLLSHARTASTSHTEPTAALWSDDSTNWSTAVAGAFFRLPDVLPGSANVTGTSSSTTLALRGGLRCRVIAYNAEVKIGVRKATIAGTYGQSTTFGAWNIATATNATAAFVAMDCDDDATSVSGHVLLPSGIAPGDDYELAVWWRPSSASGYLRAWCVWEPALSTVSP